VARRKANAASHAAKVAKKEGRALAPIKIEGRKIARTFWGQAWCDNLERYSDFANRLPRGRTYVRNGSVVDLTIENGKIKALVAGSEVYTVTISIDTLEKSTWKLIKQQCSQSIASPESMMPFSVKRNVVVVANTAWAMAAANLRVAYQKRCNIL
jgi:hypothetical protein